MIIRMKEHAIRELKLTEAHLDDVYLLPGSKSNFMLKVYKNNEVYHLKLQPFLCQNGISITFNTLVALLGQEATLMQRKNYLYNYTNDSPMFMLGSLMCKKTEYCDSTEHEQISKILNAYKHIKSRQTTLSERDLHDMLIDLNQLSCRSESTKSVPTTCVLESATR